MLNNRIGNRSDATRCRGTRIAIKGGRITAEEVNTLSLGGVYVVGASSVRSVKGMEGPMRLMASVRSAEGVAWEGEQCIMGKEACPLSRYGETLYLSPGEYVLEVDLADAPTGLEGEVCVSLVSVEDGLTISGAVPGRYARMVPAPGSTRSSSLMVGDPVRVGPSCVRRFWLWFFEPQPPRVRSVVARLENSSGSVNVIRTELFRMGIYSEAVIDALTPCSDCRVSFLSPPSLTRPLFTVSTEGCVGGG